MVFKFNTILMTLISMGSSLTAIVMTRIVPQVSEMIQGNGRLRVVRIYILASMQHMALTSLKHSVSQSQIVREIRDCLNGFFDDNLNTTTNEIEQNVCRTPDQQVEYPEATRRHRLKCVHAPEKQLKSWQFPRRNRSRV